MFSQKGVTRRSVLRVLAASTAALSAASLLGAEKSVFGQSIPVIKFGWVKQDHHTALFVAAKEWQYFRDTYGIYLEEVRPKQLYHLYKDNTLLSEVEFIETLGASNMPKNMAQGQFQMGMGGHPAVTFFVDNEAELRITSPLHSEGAALVVKPDFPAENWDEFVAYAKEATEQIRIGYKSPAAVHPLIMQRALQYEEVSFTEDASNIDAKILMINMKSAGNLIPGLTDNILDGFVVNQPQPALAEFNGIGKIIAELQTLPPPGWWEGHPCCITAARDDFIADYFDVGTTMLQTIALATKFINTNFDRATEIASDWLGTPLEVEQISMPNSQYSMEATEEWFNGGRTWLQAMKDLGRISGLLLDKSVEDAEALMYDFSMLEAAFADLDARGIEYL